MEMKKILIIIVTYNAKQWIDKCFSSVRASNYPADIFVIDNGSSDGTQEYIRRCYPEVIFRQSEKNLGFGSANNIGLEYSLNNNYDYAYLLNQDAWIFPDTLEKLISAQEQHPEYGIISPMQCEANMNSLDNNFVKNVCYNIIDGRLLDDLFFSSIKEIYEVPVVMAAHWLISRKCLLKVGGFSPTFYHYGEDDNYCDRVRFFNFKVGILTRAVAVHDRENRKESVQHKLYMFYISLLRNGSNPNKKNDVDLSLMGQALRLSIRNQTLKPYSYFFKFLCNKKNVIANRRISMNTDCAFLSHIGVEIG